MPLQLHHALAPEAAVSRANRAVGWLRIWQPEGGWALSALDPDMGYIRTRAFGLDDADAAAHWIAGWQAGLDARNIYFQVNPDRRPLGEITTKARKEHIAKGIALHADLDPRPGEDVERARERMLKRLSDPPPGVPGPPTALNFSGGGLNAMWRLREPVCLDGEETVEQFERFNIGLRDTLGADSTFDVNRLLRLPFSINLPSTKKRARGRVPAMARPVWYRTKCVYDLDQFTPAEPISRSASAGLAKRPVSPVRPVLVESLADLPVPLRTKVIVQFGSHPDELKPSRSEWVWTAILSMLRCGVSSDAVLGILTDSTWSISESVLEKPDPEVAARKQIERALDWLAEAAMREFDDEH